MKKIIYMYVCMSLGGALCTMDAQWEECPNKAEPDINTSMRNPSAKLPKNVGNIGLEKFFPLEIEYKDIGYIYVDIENGNCRIVESVKLSAQEPYLRLSDAYINSSYETTINIRSGIAQKNYDQIYTINADGKTIYLKYENDKLQPRIGSRFLSRTPSGLSVKNNVKAADIHQEKIVKLKPAIPQEESKTAPSGETPGRPEEKATRQDVHLLPSLSELKRVGACPPFAGLKSEPLYYELSDDHLESVFMPKPRSGNVNDAPCFTSINYKGYKLEFYQLRTINQTIKVEGKQIFADTCGALALFAAEIMTRYAHFGDAGILKSLYDVGQARLKAEQCYYPKAGQSSRNGGSESKFIELEKERLYSEQVKGLIELSEDFQNESDQEHITILENPQNIVSGAIEASAVWGFNREPMRKILKNGLNKKYFYYNWIMGNEDEVERGQHAGHWYTITLLKKDKTLQFIIIDSLSHFHLQPSSYDFDRLKTFAKTIVNTWL